jgi:hypothetical protein
MLQLVLTQEDFNDLTIADSPFVTITQEGVEVWISPPSFSAEAIANLEGGGTEVIELTIVGQHRETEVSITTE